jgi:hypothetical protein
MTSTSVTLQEFKRLEELYKFSTLTRAVIAGSSKQWLRKWQTWAGKTERGTWARDGGTPDEPTIKELVTLAELAGQALGGTARKEKWPVVRNADVFVTPDSDLTYVVKRREDAFLLGVHEIVRAARRSLRQCARDGCAEVFVAWRRKDFCSDQCAQTARQQQSRDQRRFRNLIKEGATEAQAAEIVAKYRAQRVAEHNARLEREAGVDLLASHPCGSR